jgi:hypothetical protein
MPKSASAAASQARQCAAAVCASLAGREPAAPALDSVCYSLLSPARALAIHGTFALSEGELVSAPRAADDAAQPSTSVAAQEALGWYAQIRAQCFAARVSAAGRRDVSVRGAAHRMMR